MMSDAEMHPTYYIPQMPNLVTDRSRFMQSACLLASRGFLFWCSGAIRPDRADADWKLLAVHRANLSRNEQLDQRRRAEPRVRVLVVDTGAEQERWPWWLMATDRLPGETMYDVREKHPHLTLDHFELVRESGPNGTNWTWRYELDGWAKLCADAQHLARAKNPRPAQMLIEQIARWPSAGGLNRQRRELFRRIWKTSKGRVVPPRVLYHRFLRSASAAS